MRKLPIEFYDREDVITIAKELIGKILVTRIEGKLTSGRIVETEAYIGLTDKASHSFGGKRTSRNEHMYGTAGKSYVYICYGMHHLFNVVTNKKEVPDAVLIRAVEPIDGIDIMLQRTGREKLDNKLTRGPGNAAKALGVSKLHSGVSLLGKEIFIIEGDPAISNNEIGASSRIGVESAGPDASMPYRFYLKGNKFVSGRPVK